MRSNRRNLTGAAAAALLFVLLACGSLAMETPRPANTLPQTDTKSTPTVAPGLIQHPTGAEDVIVQTAQCGTNLHNIGPLELPDLTLYGDGTLVYRKWDDGWMILSGFLAETAIQEILGRATGGTSFFELDDYFNHDLSSDAGTQRVTVWAGDERKTVVAYGLGSLDAGDAGRIDPKVLAEALKLQAFNKWLRRIDLRGSDDPNWRDLGAFMSDAISLVANAVDDPEIYNQPVLPWPLPEIRLREPNQPPFWQASAIVQGDQATIVRELFAESRYRYNLFSQDGAVFDVRYRSMLPYEPIWSRNGDCTQ